MAICRKLVLLLIIACPYHAFSQQQLKKGFILTASNDTLRGFIKENPDEELTQIVSFSKINDRTQLEDYASSKLMGFGFETGRIFQKFVLKELVGNDSVQKEYFAKQILTGKIYAYTIELKGKETQWLLRNQQTGRIVNLRKPKFKEVKTSDGKTAIYADVKYLQSITIVKQDSPDQYVKQDDFKYSKKQIIKNIKHYNSPYKDQYPVHHYKEQTEDTYGLLGGAFLGNVPPLNDHSISSAYRISGFRDVTWFEKISRISFTQGFSYSNFNQSPSLGGSIVGFNIPTAARILSVYPAGVKFQAYSIRVMPYIYTGLGLSFLHYEDREHQRELKAYYKSVLIAIPIGAGLKIKVSSHWFLLSEVSCIPVEGLYINGGIAYSYTRQ